MQQRVIARGYVNKGKELEARDLFRAMLEPTRAEPGCLLYEYFESKPEDTKFFENQAASSDQRLEVYVNELWADRAAQVAHASTAYFAKLMKGLPAVIDGELHVVNLTEVEPVNSAHL